MQDDPMSDGSEATSSTESEEEEEEGQIAPAPAATKESWQLRSILERWGAEPTETQTNELNQIITELESETLSEEPLNICYVGFQAVDLDIFNPGLTMDILLSPGGKDNFTIKALDSQRGGGINITWHPQCKGEHSEFHVNAAIDARGAGMVAGLLQEKGVKIDLFVFNFNVHAPSPIKAFMADKGPFSILTKARCVHEKTRLLIPHYDKTTLANFKGDSVIIALGDHPVEKAHQALLEIQCVFNPKAVRQKRHDSHHWWIDFTPRAKGSEVPAVRPPPKRAASAEGDRREDSEETSVASTSTSYASVTRAQVKGGAATPHKKAGLGRRAAPNSADRGHNTSDEDESQDSSTPSRKGGKRAEWTVASAAGRAANPSPTYTGNSSNRASASTKTSPKGKR
jgi:hypothetical protein